MKKITVKNITASPARPILLMLCASGGSVSGDTDRKMISTDGAPVELTEAEYSHCKHAVDRYEAADMLSVKTIEIEDKEAKSKAKAKADADAKAKAEADEKAKEDAEKAEPIADEAKDDADKDKDEPESEEAALRKEGKELGVKSWHVLSVENLKEAIAEAKKED